MTPKLREDNMHKYAQFAPHLLVQSTYRPYQLEVEVQLSRVRANPVGRAVIASIGTGWKNVRIVPNPYSDSYPFYGGLRVDYSATRADATAKDATGYEPYAYLTDDPTQ